MSSIQKHYAAYEAALVAQQPVLVAYHELEHAVPDKPAPSDDQIETALALLIETKLEADPSANQRFSATTKVPRWNQLLATARIAELARSRIVDKGDKHWDVADLAKTFLGKALLAEAGLGNMLLDSGDLSKLTTASAQLELELPDTIAPTTTEAFFADASTPPKAKPTKQQRST